MLDGPAGCGGTPRQGSAPRAALGTWGQMPMSRLIQRARGGAGFWPPKSGALFRKLALPMEDAWYLSGTATGVPMGREHASHLHQLGGERLLWQHGNAQGMRGQGFLQGLPQPRGSALPEAWSSV